MLPMLHKLVNVEADVVRPGDLLIDVGTGAFVTTGATVEIDTALTEIMQAFLTPDNSVTYDVDDILSTDKAITSGAVTVARGATGTSGLEFSYMFVGRIIS